MTTHVPAWKRLGLQLKHGGELAAESQQNPISGPPPKRQKIVFNEGDDEEGHVNRENAQTTDISPSDTSNGLAQHTSERQQDTPTTKQDIKPKRRKTVTFGPGTKAPDSSSEALKEAGSEVFGAAENTDNAAKRPRVKEKQKRTPTHQESAAVKSTSPYLDYLERFDKDRGSWKFSKNLQNHLLTNIFNLYRIPPSYDQALLNYISGLRGQDARRRLSEQANKIISGGEVAKSSQQTGDIGTPPSGKAEDELTAPNGDSASPLPEPEVSETAQEEVEGSEQPNDGFRSQLETRARRLKELLEVKSSCDLNSTPVYLASGMLDGKDMEAPSKKPRQKSRGRIRRLGAKAVNEMDKDSSGEVDRDKSELTAFPRGNADLTAGLPMNEVPTPS